MSVCNLSNNELLLTALLSISDVNAILEHLLEKKDKDQILALLKSNPSKLDVGRNENDLFHIACFEGWTEIIEFLLKNPKIDPTSHSSYALLCAARNSQMEVVQLLMTDGRVNPYEENGVAIHAAVKNKRKDIVDVMLYPILKPMVITMGTSNDIRIGSGY